MLLTAVFFDCEELHQVPAEISGSLHHGAGGKRLDYWEAGMVSHGSVASPIFVTRSKGYLATTSTNKAITPECRVPPIIWETGNVLQIGSLLSFREAKLTLATTQLTGYAYSDWHVRNQIIDLEIKITDLKRLLAETNKGKGD